MFLFLFFALIFSVFRSNLLFRLEQKTEKKHLHEKQKKLARKTELFIFFWWMQYASVESRPFWISTTTTEQIDGVTRVSWPTYLFGGCGGNPKGAGFLTKPWKKRSNQAPKQNKLGSRQGNYDWAVSVYRSCFWLALDLGCNGLCCGWALCGFTLSFDRWVSWRGSRPLSVPWLWWKSKRGGIPR